MFAAFSQPPEPQARRGLSIGSDAAAGRRSRTS
jgi:hypothetical protein